MLTHPTHDRLLALGLTGIAKALEEQRRSPAFDDLSFEERKRAFLRTLESRAFWRLIWAKVAPDQATVAVLGKLKGSRSVISALSARCGNSVRTWRSQANGSTPQARQVSMRL